MTETRYERIAREQRERQERRAKQQAQKMRHERDIYRGAAKIMQRERRRRQAAMDVEAEYMPDSFDPPDTPEF